MFCKFCGSQIEDGSKFCKYCGNSLVAASGNTPNNGDNQPKSKPASRPSDINPNPTPVNGGKPNNDDGTRILFGDGPAPAPVPVAPPNPFGGNGPINNVPNNNNKKSKAGKSSGSSSDSIPVGWIIAAAIIIIAAIIAAVAIIILSSSSTPSPSTHPSKVTSDDDDDEDDKGGKGDKGDKDDDTATPTPTEEVANNDPTATPTPTPTLTPTPTPTPTPWPPLEISESSEIGMIESEVAARKNNIGNYKKKSIGNITYRVVRENDTPVIITVPQGEGIAEFRNRSTTRTYYGSAIFYVEEKDTVTSSVDKFYFTGGRLFYCEYQGKAYHYGCEEWEEMNALGELLAKERAEVASWY